MQELPRGKSHIRALRSQVPQLKSRLRMTQVLPPHPRSTFFMSHNPYSLYVILF